MVLCARSYTEIMWTEQDMQITQRECVYEVSLFFSQNSKICMVYQTQWNTSPVWELELVCVGVAVKHTMYQLKVDVDMLNAIKSVLADVSSISPMSEQRAARVCSDEGLKCSKHQPTPLFMAFSISTSTLSWHILWLSDMTDTFFEWSTRCAKVCGLFLLNCFLDANWLRAGELRPQETYSTQYLP